MRALVVEDAESVRRLLETVLSERGHEVAAVASGEDALIAHEAAPADLVLIDLVLPGMSGIDLVRRIRALPSGDAPVIVAFTGRADDSALEPLLAAGVDDYLTKPLTPDELRRRLTIAEACARRMASQRAEAGLRALGDSDKASLRLQAELHQADRLASVGQLAVGIAHEINNPLALVLTNLRLLAEEVERGQATSPVAQELLSEAIEGAERIRSTVRDLKTFTRISEGSGRPVDPVPIVEASLRMAYNQLRHRARIERRLDAVPRVSADEPRLAQVFLNLLLSSADALPEGHAEAHLVTVATFTDSDGRAVVEIADTGRGLEPFELDRIFEPYAVGSAGGLDLSVCHNIVASMGGHIQVRSAPGEGRAFRVVLPPAKSRSQSAPPPAKTERREPRGSARVLVIDDEALVGRSLKRALKGHDVTVAETGQGALDLFAAGESFDVVLCDLMMPEVTGMDVYERVEREHPHLTERFVFMTGGAFTPRARAFLDRVPNERLEKPFDVTRVRELVSERARS